ncbi:MAG: winged helix-turn-helix domain-containing protein [Woeseiaceae bacterium]|nr:winged helix-turn-helix domain-containing protein [Woeseiaceae bacterium]
MSDRRPTQYLIGEWLVEPDAGRITRDGATTTLRPREMDLLVYLAERPGQVVRTDDIMQDVWSGVEVTNDSLYFSVSQMRKALDGDDAGSLIETIPKRGYRLTAPVRRVESGEPTTAAVPAPETADGRDNDNSPRRGLHVGLAAAVAAVGVFWFVQGGEEPTPAREDIVAVAVPDQHSIAVLPFVDLSPEADYTYFSDGISEEILNRLTRVSGLRVAARTSSFAFKDSPEDVVEIGRSLGVANLLEGSVRKEGDRVRISVQLIDAATGFQMWSDSFDRQLTSVFEIQDEISRRIADALQITLASTSEIGGSKTDTAVSPAALDDYLMGLEGYRISSFDSLREAERRFRDALQQEPEFHAARIQLAATLLQLVNVGATSDPALIDEAESLVLAALDARPDDAHAHKAYGVVLKYQNEGEAARREFIRALELAPSDASAMVHLAQSYAKAGDVAGARRLLDRAMRIDPFSVKLLHSYSLIERQFGMVENARYALERAVAVHPENPNPWWMLGEILVSEYGELANGLNLFLQAAERDPSDYEIAAYVAAAYLTLDQLEEATVWIERAESTGPDDAVTTQAVRALYAGAAGDEEQSRAAAREGIEDRSERFFARAHLTSPMLKTFINASIGSGDGGDAADLLLSDQPQKHAMGPDRVLGEDDLEGLVTLSDLPRRWMLETAIALQADGRDDEALQLTTALQPLRIDAVDGIRDRLRSDDFLFEAEMLALEGDADGAFDRLNEAVDRRFIFQWQVFYRDNAALRNLHADPRWDDLLARIEGQIASERQLASRNVGMLAIDPPYSAEDIRR